MPKNQIDKEEVNTRVLKLKNTLYNGTYLGASGDWLTTPPITCLTRSWTSSKNIGTGSLTKSQDPDTINTSTGYGM